MQNTGDSTGVAGVYRRQSLVCHLPKYKISLPQQKYSLITLIPDRYPLSVKTHLRILTRYFTRAFAAPYGLIFSSAKFYFFFPFKRAAMSQAFNRKIKGVYITIKVFLINSSLHKRSREVV